MCYTTVIRRQRKNIETSDGEKTVFNANKSVLPKLKVYFWNSKGVFEGWASCCCCCLDELVLSVHSTCTYSSSSVLKTSNARSLGWDSINDVIAIEQSTPVYCLITFVMQPSFIVLPSPIKKWLSPHEIVYLSEMINQNEYRVCVEYRCAGSWRVLVLYVETKIEQRNTYVRTSTSVPYFFFARIFSRLPAVVVTQIQVHKK